MREQTSSEVPARPRGWTEARVPRATDARDYRESAKPPRDELVLTGRWGLAGQRVPFAFIMLVWWAFVAVFGGLMWVSGGEGATVDAFLWIAFLAFAISGAHLAYLSVATFLNQTVVRTRGESVEVRSGPLPWPGGRGDPVAMSGLEGFRVVKTNVAIMGRQLHGVSAELVGGAQRIVRGPFGHDEASWVAQRLAAHFGVPVDP